MSDESASLTEQVTRAGRDPDRMVALGRIVGTFGVKGWVKIQSYTDPPKNILGYENWRMRQRDEWQPVKVEGGRVTGQKVLAKLEGIDTPEDARLYIGAELGVARSELPEPAPGQYYWSDLEGLEARGLNDEVLGRVDHFRSTPGGTVVVVRGEREHWIPFVKDRILKVDLAAGRITFEWAADW